MYIKLCRARPPILPALGFTPNRTCLARQKIPMRPDERRKRGIASNSQRPNSRGCRVCRNVKKPQPFLPRELLRPIEWAIADDYRRDDERPGTHWQETCGETRLRRHAGAAGQASHRLVERLLGAVRSCGVPPSAPCCFSLGNYF